jgi:hypothetical protein
MCRWISEPRRDWSSVGPPGWDGVGRPVPGNRDDCKAGELSGAKSSVGNTTVIADGGSGGTGLIIPHRREPGQSELPTWKEAHNTSPAKSAPESSTPSPA